MGLPQKKKTFTPAEYYALEKDAKYRSEYYNGEIFAMAGGTERHSLIVTNISGELRARLRDTPCTPHDSNLKIMVEATGLRAYPDVAVICGPATPDRQDPTRPAFTNPTAIFEVLSKSTEAFDRGLKWGSYRRIDSLRSYALVSQKEPRVEVFLRQTNGKWINEEIQGMDGVVRLPDLGVELPMSEIYLKVDFSIDADAD